MKPKSSPRPDKTSYKPDTRPNRHPKRAAKPKKTGRSKSVLLYGRHAVTTALDNPNRLPIRLYLSASAAESLKADGAMTTDINTDIADPARLDALLPKDAVHQGIILEASPLPVIDLETWLDNNGSASRLLLLDQISDPRNLGAILRSAAAFDADAVLLPERHSANLSGACAKAAAGALDLLPIIQIGNLAASLKILQDRNFWTVGLTGDAEAKLGNVLPVEKLVLVLGAEGSGLRRLTAERCDQLARLPMSTRIDSLNVAVAAGIALYETFR